ncbi:MAG: RNA 2',3'-cyclic phosphodiesterase [Clostridia bacterium]|nr:RNA 2',3'-cyclic phosphodiesterase [Clostridia bacterium]
MTPAANPRRAPRTEGRLFLAVPLPGRLSRSLGLFASRLKETIPGRYVTEDNYHVTLAFIGEAPLSLAQGLRPFLSETAAAFPAVPAELSNLGWFGKPANAILWAGLKNGEALLPLADALRAGLRQRHIRFDPKPVRPHITLARKADVAGRELPALPAGSGILDMLVLFHSTRVQGRLTYIPICSVPIGDQS